MVRKTLEPAVYRLLYGRAKVLPQVPQPKRKTARRRRTRPPKHFEPVKTVSAWVRQPMLQKSVLLPVNQPSLPLQRRKKRYLLPLTRRGHRNCPLRG